MTLDADTRTQSRFTDAQRFLLLAVLVGVMTGLVVVCFHAAIELLAWFTMDYATSPALRILAPGIGAAAATLVVRYLAPAGRGSGIVQTKSAIYVLNGHIPASAVPGKFASCCLSIGTGTPLGPEDPSLLMGAGIASWLGRVFELSRRSMRLVAPTGAAAGIAAAFNTPITAVLFVMEEVVAAWDAAVLGSIVLAAVSAVVVTRLFLGDAPLFSVPDLVARVEMGQVLAFALVGAASGIFAAMYVRGIAAVRRRVRLRALRVPGLAPFAAGAAAGAVGLWLPEVLGPGYRAMDAAMHGQYPWTTMALLGGAKLVVAALAFGAGSPGGLFAPTLFLGVMLGGTVAGAVGALGPGVLPALDAPAVMFVLAGISGVFAGVFRAPMTAVFMVFELSGSSAIIVPAMITGTLGFLVARTLHHRSLLDLVADDEGAVLPSARQLREEEPLRVEQALGRATVAVVPIDATRATARVAAQSSGARFVLTLSDGRWRGMLSTTLDHAPDAAAPDHRSLSDDPALRPLEVVHLDEPVDVALRHLASQPFVPVVSRLDPAVVDGIVTLEDVHAAYGIGPPAPAAPD